MGNDTLVLHALPDSKFSLPVLDWMSHKAVLSSYTAVSPVTAVKFDKVVAVLPLDTDDEDTIARATDLWTDALLNEWEIVYVDEDGVHVSVPEPEEPEVVEQPPPKPKRSRTGSAAPRKKETVPDAVEHEGVTEPLDPRLEDKEDTPVKSVTFDEPSDQDERTSMRVTRTTDLEDSQVTLPVTDDPGHPGPDPGHPELIDVLEVEPGVDFNELPRVTGTRTASTATAITYPTKSASEERLLALLEDVTATQRMIVQYLIDSGK